jgi:hypothetical protein
MGSVYSHDIVLVKVNGRWEKVEHTEKQKALKNTISSMGW